MRNFSALLRGCKDALGDALGPFRWTHRIWGFHGVTVFDVTRLKRGFHFLWIMAVFTASVLPSRVGNGHVSVTIEIVTSFSGEDVCSFQMPGGTLADLEGVLCDSTGPMSWCCPSSRLLFYTEDEPSRPRLTCNDRLVRLARW